MTDYKRKFYWSYVTRRLVISLLSLIFVLTLVFPNSAQADCCSCENSFGDPQAVCLSDSAWRALHGEQCADGSTPTTDLICSLDNKPCVSGGCIGGTCEQRSVCANGSAPQVLACTNTCSGTGDVDTCIAACGMTTNSCCICNGTGTFVCAKSTDPNVYTTEESCPSTYNEDKRAGGRGCTTAADCTGNCTYLNPGSINVTDPGSAGRWLEGMNPLGGLDADGNPTGICAGDFTIGCIMSYVINSIVFPLSGLFLFLMIVWGGYQMVNGSLMGSQNTIQRGQQRIKGAFLGFLMLAAVYWLWGLIQALTGIQIT